MVCIRSLVPPSHTVFVSKGSASSTPSMAQRENCPCSTASSSASQLRLKWRALGAGIITPCLPFNQVLLTNREEALNLFIQALLAGHDQIGSDRTGNGDVLIDRDFRRGAD